jgi:ribonuclease E
VGIAETPEGEAPVVGEATVAAPLAPASQASEPTASEPTPSAPAAIEPAAAAVEPVEPAPVAAPVAVEAAKVDAQPARAADEAGETAALQSSLPFGGAAPASAPAAGRITPAAEAPRAPATVSAEPVAESLQQAESAVAAAAMVPKQQLEAIVESAGLQWVETTAPTQAAVEPEFVPPPRPARKRKPRTVIASEPLQQVETAASAGGEPNGDGQQAG